MIRCRYCGQHFGTLGALELATGLVLGTLFGRFGGQPDMLAFTGDCHVHRGELMELHGAWADALAELDRAASRATRAGNARVAAQAAYRRGLLRAAAIAVRSISDSRAAFALIFQQGSLLRRCSSGR